MDHKMSRSPWVIHYDGSSCNGCDIEVLASLTPLFDAERFGVVNTGNPKHADIFLVTGSVNAQNLPVVRQIYNQMLEPKCVVACGICACSGGVFRDAYNVIGGVDRAIPVDVYAPGCAIRPETVIDAIVEACGILDQKEAVMRAGGDPLTVGGAATWDGGVELGEDGFVAAAEAGDATHKMSRSPWVIHYDGSSCNGCDIEVLASLTPLFDAERFGVVNTGNPKHADIFLVTGSVNAQNLPVVRQIYNQMLEPKCVVACGICACSGGVFRDAYNVIGGVDRAIPVDVYAPGCAIRPETVIDAIVEACGILDQKEAVMRAGGDPLTVGGAATWDGGVELGEDGFVAAAEAGDATAAGDAPAGTPAAAKEAE